MSPGWTDPKSSWVRVTRAGPRTIPAEAPVPRISSAHGRLVARAVEAVRIRGAARLVGSGALPTLRGGVTVDQCGVARRAGSRRGRATAPPSRRSGGTSSRWRNRMSAGAAMTPASASRPPTRIDEPAQDRLRAPVDPVVVDLGQRPDLAGVTEQLLEPREALGIVRQRRPRPRGQDVGLVRQSPAPRLGIDRHRVLDPLADLGQQEARLLDPRREAEVVVHLAEMAVLGEEGPQGIDERLRARRPPHLLEGDAGSADRPLDARSSRPRASRGAPARARPRGARGRSRRSARAPRPGAALGHDRFVQVGQVVHHLVRAADRVEVDAPRSADPLPHLVPRRRPGRLRSAVSTGRAATQS